MKEPGIRNGTEERERRKGKGEKRQRKRRKSKKGKGEEEGIRDKTRTSMQKGPSAILDFLLYKRM